MGRHHSAVESEQSKIMCSTSPRGLTSQCGCYLSSAPHMPFGTEPFPGPSQLHSGTWVVFSFPEASLGVLFLKGEVLPLAPLRVCGAGSSWPEKWGLTLGALMAGCQNSPFKAPFLLMLLLLPLSRACTPAPAIHHVVSYIFACPEASDSRKPPEALGHQRSDI